ncbi:unnamed protein product [Trypanosoma congolense IL3000]|uniref:WGS project CAEQ00000000 data, annotated contig 903 n=1 Tax=Trypanosoma congolense (strain IL3000) TaxID=1068625 RepID=F9WJF3_TRYCI|nr:unnamed protein product [Trypanosoma congolense IL3000]
MLRFLCLCWLMAGLGLGWVSGKGPDTAVCELSPEAKKVLCTVAYLMESVLATSKDFIQENSVEGRRLEDLEMNRRRTSEARTSLLHLLSTTGVRDRYKPSDVDKLKTMARQAEESQDETYLRAWTAVSEARHFSQWAYEETTEVVLGDADVEVLNCTAPTTLLAHIRCHVQPTAVQSNAPGHTNTWERVNHVCGGKKSVANSLKDKKTKDVLLHCTGPVAGRGDLHDFCLGVGTSLQSTMDQWRKLRENWEVFPNTKEGKECHRQRKWKGYAYETVNHVANHMNHVVERMMSVEEARKQSQAFLVLVSSLHEGVQKGKNMTQLLEHTKKAVKETVKEGGKSAGMRRIMDSHFRTERPWYNLLTIVILPLLGWSALFLGMFYYCVMCKRGRKPLEEKERMEYLGRQVYYWNNQEDKLKRQAEYLEQPVQELKRDAQQYKRLAGDCNNQSNYYKRQLKELKQKHQDEQEMNPPDAQ